MNNSGFVRFRKTVGNLRGQPDNLGNGHRALVHALAQGHAIHQFQSDVGDRARPADVVDRDNVGVAES